MADRGTDGDAIDYDVIRKRVNELAERYPIREVAIDRWNATQISPQLKLDKSKQLLLENGAKWSIQVRGSTGRISAFLRTGDGGLGVMLQYVVTVHPD